MATVPVTRIWQAHDGEADLYEWAALGAGDDGAWLALPVKADRAVHVWGTLGAGTVSIQGTLETDTPAQPVVLNDSRGEGNPLTFASVPDVRTVLENVLRIRPVASAGVTTATVRLLAVRSS